MAILQVQEIGPIATTNAGAGGHVASWGSNTTTGNLLVAIWTFRTRGTAPTTLTGMAGWTFLCGGVAGVNSGYTTATHYTNIYYIQNAAQRLAATPEAFKWTGGTNMDGCVWLGEYSDVVTSSAPDQFTQATGSGTTNAVTGTTGTTTQAEELWIGGLGWNNTPTCGALSNSFTELGEVQTANATNGSRSNLIVGERIVTATGTVGFGGTLSATSQYSGAIASFKEDISGATPTGFVAWI